MKKFKLWSILLLWLTTFTHVNADETNEHVIDTFFDQYQLISSQGFSEFAKQRRALFSDDSITIVHDEVRTEYQGKSGHIQSLKDWFQVYQTHADFSYRIESEPRDETHNQTVAVGLYGTLTKRVDGKAVEIPPEAHLWTEYFRFNQAGEISELQLDMNILSDSYNAQAREHYSTNDVASFVYQWFAAFDHQRESG